MGQVQIMHAHTVEHEQQLNHSSLILTQQEEGQVHFWGASQEIDTLTTKV
jgi:hypothetical protein